MRQHAPNEDAAGASENAERRTSREAVIDAGLRLIDSDGAAGLSMRRVAEEMGVPVMTLYGFVRTKRELVEAVSERAFAGLFKSERREGAWNEQLRALTDDLHGALRDHPGVVELVLTDSVPSGIFDDVREALLSILDQAGLDQADALQALGGFYSLALGFAAAARTRSAQRSSDEVTRLKKLHPAEYPHLSQATADYPSHLSRSVYEQRRPSDRRLGSRAARKEDEENRTMTESRTAAATKTPFWETKNGAFVIATADCDLLHPESRAEEQGNSLTETQHLGFNLPDEDIHGLCYMWHHPNLGVVTGGAWVWQGIKRHNLQSEIFDIVTYASDECLRNDLHDYTLENGYRVTTLEPLRRYRIRYSDAHRHNSFDIELQAVMPAMVLSSGKHLEQRMRARGVLTLGGREFEVDCFTVRDPILGAAPPGTQHRRTLHGVDDVCIRR